jgi:hypothetical protein
MISAVLVALFSQAAELVVATVLPFGTSFVPALGFEITPPMACSSKGTPCCWSPMKVRLPHLAPGRSRSIRTAEILVGIACGTLASAVILPRCAGDGLREARAITFVALARYVATALGLQTRRVCLCASARNWWRRSRQPSSFALFVAPERRTNEKYLRRSVFEFLVVFSIARGLSVRLEKQRDNAGRQVHVPRSGRSLPGSSVVPPIRTLRVTCGDCEMSSSLRESR